MVSLRLQNVGDTHRPSSLASISKCHIVSARLNAEGGQENMRPTSNIEIERYSIETANGVSQIPPDSRY
jgi:hypothetical protein